LKEKKMKPFAPLVCLIACLPLGAAMAGDFDGSKLLLCATAEALDCSSGAECTKGLPGDFSLPTFLRVDISKKTVAGPKTTTQITVMEKSEKEILLGGSELGYAWTIAVDSEDGSMSGSITNRSGVYVFFGECTPL
jgi:hypothetical protein